MIPILMAVAFGLFIHKIRKDHLDIDARVAEGKAALASTTSVHCEHAHALPDVDSVFPTDAPGDTAVAGTQHASDGAQTPQTVTTEEDAYTEELA